MFKQFWNGFILSSTLQVNLKVPSSLENVCDLFVSRDVFPVARHAAEVPAGGNVKAGLILEAQPQRVIVVFCV